MDLLLQNLQDNRITFWSGGNAPTQKTMGLSEQEVSLHLKATYLLSDKIIAAASFYFESEITRNVLDGFWPILKAGDILFFIDDDIESYTDHGLIKSTKSPPSLKCYHDKTYVQMRGAILDSVGYTLRRPSLSISERIVDLWVKDISSSREGTSGYLLKRIIHHPKRQETVRSALLSAAYARDKDFVWEYLEPVLHRQRLPLIFCRFVRRRLSQLYSQVTAEMLGASVDRPETLDVSASSKYDSGLFIGCLETLNAVDPLRRLSARELIELKSASAFLLFREFYFTLVEDVSYCRPEARIWVSLLREFATVYARRELRKNDFLNTFEKYCQSVGINNSKFRKPLDVLLSVFDSTARLVIDDFLSSLRNSLAPEEYSGVITQPAESELSKFADQPHSKGDQMIRILFLPSNPRDSQPLRLAEEERSINERLRLSDYRDRFDVRQHWAVRVDDIQGYLLRDQPTIVHFSGHGNKQGEIILENNVGDSAIVPQTALRDLFKQFSSSVRCVVLNSCYSESQARAIAEHIDFVVGMTSAIGDSSAVVFAAGFYESLGYGRSIAQAFALGCNRIDLNRLGDADKPKLLTLRGVNPEKVRFVE